MKMRFVWLLLLACGLALSVYGCAGLQKPVVLEGKKEYVVNMKMISSDFQPNNLQTYRGEVIVFRLENLTNKDHNFAVKDPDGKLVQSTDVLPGKVKEMRIDFARAGVYTFYSDKMMDRIRSMKGQVVVVTR